METRSLAEELAAKYGYGWAAMPHFAAAIQEAIERCAKEAEAMYAASAVSFELGSAIAARITNSPILIASAIRIAYHQSLKPYQLIG